MGGENNCQSPVNLNNKDIDTYFTLNFKKEHSPIIAEKYINSLAVNQIIAIV